MKIKKFRIEMYYIFLSCLFCQKNYGIRAVIHKDFDALFCNTCFSDKLYMCNCIYIYTNI